MLWIALHLPLLSLEAFCASLPAEAAGGPIALVAVVDGEHKISAVNAAAAACGIRPGLKRPTALALAGNLLLAQADSRRDSAALQAVVHAALAFTPAVTGHDEHTVLLEVQASLRLFGGAGRLLQTLRSALQPLGHRVQIAAAPTALGAALLARWFPPALRLQTQTQTLAPHSTDLAALHALLDAVPVEFLGPGRAHWDALQGMGLHTLSDLRQLPRSGLARRFSQDLLDDLDRAYGLQPDPRCWITVPAVFESRLELFARADSSEQVLHGAAVLLARLVVWARARQSRVAAFTLCMQHEPRHSDNAAPATELQVQLAEPALDAAHLQLLLRERLANAQLPAPTLELRLVCSQLVHASPPNGELFPTRGSQQQGLTRLLERLRARLGDAQVLRLQAVADHRPERATLAVPVQSLPASLPASTAKAQDDIGRSETPALPLHRPAWLLPESLPLAERDAMPCLDGRPLRLLSGPERIETGWWDDDPVARDYFIAQAGDGALVWVWRGRLPAPPGAVNWFLQGRFG